MEDSNNSMDIFGSKTVAKIADKTVTKFLDGLGEFIKLICAPAAEEFGLLLKDKISFYRIVNLFKISEKINLFVRIRQHPEFIKKANI